LKQNNLGGFKAKLPANFCSLGMTQLVGMPVRQKQRFAENLKASWRKIWKILAGPGIQPPDAAMVAQNAPC
jgi:hypothetical protein